MMHVVRWHSIPTPLDLTVPERESLGRLVLQKFQLNTPVIAAEVLEVEHGSLTPLTALFLTVTLPYGLPLHLGNGGATLVSHQRGAFWR